MLDLLFTVSQMEHLRAVEQVDILVVDPLITVLQLDQVVEEEDVLQIVKELLIH